MNFVKFITALIVLLVAASFGVKNMAIVNVAYWFGNRTIALPTFFLVLISFALGAFVAWTYFGLNHIRLRRLVEEQQRALAGSEERLGEQDPTAPSRFATISPGRTPSVPREGHDEPNVE